MAGLSAESKLAQCRWPVLAAPYARALREAVELILARFDVTGIVACGSILRGQGGPTSDLDVYVVHADPVRQRLQHSFNGVPAEIFVNPPAAIRSYFAGEHRSGRPCTAHMLHTGFVVFEQGPMVATLRHEAEAWLAKPRDLTDADLTMQRYLAADQLDNARDLVGQDDANAALLLYDAVKSMIQYGFAAAQQPQPRVKQTLVALGELDPEAHRLARRFYGTDGIDKQLAVATDLAQHILGVTGFFAWEAPPEAFPDPDLPSGGSTG